MSAIGEMITIAAATLPVWRDLAVGSLACLVILCLWVYASAVGAE